MWAPLGMTGKNAEQPSTRREFHTCLIIAAFFLNCDMESISYTLIKISDTVILLSSF